jgi:hypothetical protein
MLFDAVGQFDELTDVLGPGIDIEAALAIWADLRRRQGDAAAARIEREGLDPQWLAELQRRLEELAAAEAAVGKDRWEVAAAGDSAVEGVRTLRQAVSFGTEETKAMAEAALLQLCFMTIPNPQYGDGVDRILELIDREVRRVAKPVLGLNLEQLDARERERARGVRRFSLAALVTAATAGAVALGRGHYLLSLVLLGSAVLVDLLEGSVGRIAEIETPVGRWVSMLIGHAAEFAFVIGMAADQRRLHHPGMAFVLLVTVVVAQFGTFTRMTARLAGDPPGLALVERAVRFVAIALYIGSFLFFWPMIGVSLRRAAPVMSVVLFGGYGVRELVRVVSDMVRRPVDSVITIIQGNGESYCFVNQAPPAGVGRE